MSRQWTRAAVLTKCGGPCRKGDGYIKAGEPMLELRLVESNVRKVRCAECAGEPVPANLPPLVNRSAIPPTPLARFDANSLPFDFRSVRSGEREPGSDDD